MEVKIQSNRVEFRIRPAGSMPDCNVVYIYHCIYLLVIMKKIAGYLLSYTRSLHPFVTLLSVLFIGFAVYFNYYFDLNEQIELRSPPERFICWWGVFICAFSFSYSLFLIFSRSRLKPSFPFLWLLLIATALFAVKMAMPLKFPLSEDESRRDFLNALIYFPLKLTVMLLALYFLWKKFDPDQPFYGTTVRHFKPGLYFLMLLVMLPLITIASFQPDFREIYPKFLHLSWFSEGRGTALDKLLYELSYGTDFISIEFFFRGFLVLAFVKWAGKNAILPMAMFYCTIHFGKPLGECISSFFGGILLGVITYHTRTIWSGLIVHLGIAWMMELAGYFVAN
jgi:hypothetical protein